MELRVRTNDHNKGTRQITVSATPPQPEKFYKGLLNSLANQSAHFRANTYTPGEGGTKYHRLISTDFKPARAEQLRNAAISSLTSEGFNIVGGGSKQKRNPSDIGNKPEFAMRTKRIGVKRLKNTGKYKRAAVAETEVDPIHKRDQNLMARIFGGKTILEKNFVDVITDGVHREYKPDVTSGDIHEALGKLWSIKRAMKAKAFGFITRRRLSAAVIKLFTDMGAFVELLTLDKRVVRQ